MLYLTYTYYDFSGLMMMLVSRSMHFYKELVILVRNRCTWNDFDEWYDFEHKQKYM